MSFTPRQKKVVIGYIAAKNVVIERGFGAEIDWQDQVRLSQVTESNFLREAAWVVLSSGMREAVVRQKFPAFSRAFHDWQSAKRIVDDLRRCRVRALKVFGHQLKVNAILTIAELTSEHGFEYLKGRIETGGILYIRSMPFMGPKTSYHLAKNLGLDVVKPDRHLLRLATVTGYGSPHLLCQEISRLVGDRISVVDLVIWRFATLYSNFSEYFS